MTGFSMVLLGFISKSFYRDYINLNHINDYGIAGFLPSYFYVAGFALLLLIRPSKHPLMLVSFVTLASVLFELKQYGSSGHFDYKDAIASIAGGLTAFIILKIIDRKASLNHNLRKDS